MTIRALANRVGLMGDFYSLCGKSTFVNSTKCAYCRFGPLHHGSLTLIGQTAIRCAVRSKQLHRHSGATAGAAERIRLLALRL